MISDVIGLMGHEVMEAADGESGLVLARTEPLPDLILLDVNMPGMDGFQVCRILKNDPLTKSIPIIFLTSYAESEDRVRGLDIGADDYLTKPFAIRELSARIDKRLQARKETKMLLQQQADIRQTFERFVAPEFVDILLRETGRVILGGDLQHITVLFTDLEGFTTLSEDTAPALLLGVLNRYHELVSGLVQQHGGIVNKFIGDGVMALFNTPIPRDNHARCAVDAALAIRKSLPALHADLEERFRLQINCGIHTGPAIVGKVGATHCMDYTALGDTVNLAARLQEMAAQGQILISAATMAELDAGVRVKELGEVLIRNRSKSVNVFEVSEQESK